MRAITALTPLLLLVAVGSAQESATPEIDEAPHERGALQEHSETGDVVGGALVLATTPLGADDAYSNPFGFSVFYDTSRIFPWDGVRLGAALTSYQMLPRREEFGTSVMLLPTVTGRFTAERLSPFPGVRFWPYVSLGSYLRWYTFLSDRRFAARPVITLGWETRLSLQPRSVYALALSYSALWEERLRSLVSITASIGYRFEN